MRKAANVSPEQLLEMENDIRFFCSTWNEKEALIVSKSRLIPIVMMRKILVAFIYKKYPTITQKMIAERLGMNDHTTIGFHLKTFQDLLDVKYEVFMTYYEPIKHLFDAGDKEIQGNVG